MNNSSLVAAWNPNSRMEVNRSPESITIVGPRGSEQVVEARAVVRRIDATRPLTPHSRTLPCDLRRLTDNVCLKKWRGTWKEPVVGSVPVQLLG